MAQQITKELKLIFLIHFFTSIVIGLVFLVMTEWFVALIDWPNPDPAAGRLLGCAIIGFAASSLLAWRETEWIRVKILVQMEMVWCVLGGGVLIGSFFMLENMPLFTWVFIVVLLAFFVAFAWFYFVQERD
jgi:amino acid transporter